MSCPSHLQGLGPLFPNVKTRGTEELSRVCTNTINPLLSRLQSAGKPSVWSVPHQEGPPKKYQGLQMSEAIPICQVGFEAACHPQPSSYFSHLQIPFSTFPSVSLQMSVSVSVNPSDIASCLGRHTLRQRLLSLHPLTMFNRLSFPLITF